MPRAWGAFRLTLELGKGPNSQSASSSRKRALLLTVAILAPLLVVGGAWMMGLLRFPTLEAWTGITPWRPTADGPGELGVWVEVNSPQDSVALSGVTMFDGLATGEVKVYMWEAKSNVPVLIPTSPSGAWEYAFIPQSLSPGFHTLHFAATDGKAWSLITTRTIEVLAVESSTPQSFGWLPGPLVAIAGAIGKTIGGVGVTISQTTGFNLQNDLNQDHVPDWLQSSLVSPVKIPPRLTPLIDSPAWLNLIVLVVVVSAPAAILIWKRPQSVISLLRQRGLLRAKDRRERRAHILAEEKLGAKAERERALWDSASKMHKELTEIVKDFKDRANRHKVETYRLRQDALKQQANARAAEVASESRARVDIERLRGRSLVDARRAEVEKARLEQDRARDDARSRPSTIIHLHRPGPTRTPRRRRWRL